MISSSASSRGARDPALWNIAEMPDSRSTGRNKFGPQAWHRYRRCAALIILPWQGRWLAEGQTEGCPAIVTVTPLRPALRARHLPCQGRMAKNHHSRHSREGGNPTLYRVGAKILSVGCRPFLVIDQCSSSRPNPTLIHQIPAATGSAPAAK